MVTLAILPFWTLAMASLGEEQQDPEATNRSSTVLEHGRREAVEASYHQEITDKGYRERFFVCFVR